MLLPLVIFSFIASLNLILFPSLVLRWFVEISDIFPGARTSFPSKASQQPLLRLNADNEFNIAIFSDLHYGEKENGWGIQQDINSTRVMNKILDYEDPDFVVLNGDLITGDDTFKKNSSKNLYTVVKPLVEHNISWASTYGNHDTQYNLNPHLTFAEEYKYLLSYTQHSPKSLPGVTNYYLPLYPHSSDKSSIPIAILWFFDSRGGTPFQIPFGSMPNWVEASVVAWFIATQAQIYAKYKKNIPSLAFVHIPPTSFLKLQKTLLPNKGSKNPHYPGLNFDVPVANQGEGYRDTKDLGFMQALVNTPNLHSVYSGHDHGNSWCANWPEGVAGLKDGLSRPKVCFCKHTGYGGYGEWRRGSRMLKLRFGDEGSGEMEVDSWVRLEEGDVVQRVGLNETYGVDVYSGEDGEE